MLTSHAFLIPPRIFPSQSLNQFPTKTVWFAQLLLQLQQIQQILLKVAVQRQFLDPQKD